MLLHKTNSEKQASILDLQNSPSIYQLGSDFVKKMLIIPIPKSEKILLWNQVKSRMEACYSELILVVHIRSYLSLKCLSDIISQFQTMHSQLFDVQEKNRLHFSSEDKPHIDPQMSFFNFSCRFLNPNIFFQFEL